MNHHRRQVLKLGLAGLVFTLPACAGRNGAGAGPSDEPLLGFKAVPVSTADAIAVPPGYRAQVLYAWGDAVGAAAGQPAFKWDASNSAAERSCKPACTTTRSSSFRGANRGLLAINHEYTDDGLLHADGMKTCSAEKVRKS